MTALMILARVVMALMLAPLLLQVGALKKEIAELEGKVQEADRLLKVSRKANLQMNLWPNK